MPEMDGHDLLRAVRRLPDEDGGRTPAIALSAYVSAEDRLQALAAGYQEQLPKPVEIRTLVATITRLLAEARSSGEGASGAGPDRLPPSLTRA